jgi:hypothetical protein
VIPDGFFTVMPTLSACDGAGLTDPAMVYACVPEKDAPRAGLENDIEPRTVSVNDVERVTIDVPLTVTEYVPGAVEDDVIMVSVLEKVGDPEEGLKLHEAPEGSPALQAKETGRVEPLLRVAAIEFDPELPEATEILPELATEKSNGGPVTFMLTMKVPH